LTDWAKAFPEAISNPHPNNRARRKRLDVILFIFRPVAASTGKQARFSSTDDRRHTQKRRCELRSPSPSTSAAAWLHDRSHGRRRCVLVAGIVHARNPRVEAAPAWWGAATPRLRFCEGAADKRFQDVSSIPAANETITPSYVE
jgi:hypothetical protein